MKIGIRRSAAVLALAMALFALNATPAEARTDNRTKPVVFVHGYNPFGDGTSCTMWDPMVNAMRSWGFTGAVSTVRYYKGDTGCTHALESFGANGRHYDPGTTYDRYVRLEHLGYRLAWMIYSQYSSRGITVDIVSHSMGGLITRYALAQVARRHADFPPYLYVEDSVTLGTPHAGTGWASWCWTTQCEQMRPGSSFVSWLAANAPNPQGSGGTDWTAVGAYDDEIVSESSAIAMSAAHKIQYLDSADVAHSDYYNDTTDARTADVRYNDGGGPFYTWYDAPWGVRWSDFALLYGTW
jgi:pimeloyl-ACP methyl ester carboxylesterase